MLSNFENYQIPRAIKIISNPNPTKIPAKIKVIAVNFTESLSGRLYCVKRINKKKVKIPRISKIQPQNPL